MSLDSAVSELKGVTKSNAVAMHALGVETVKDLLFCLPTRYEDYTSVVPLMMLRPGERCTAVAEVLSVRLKRAARRRLSILEAAIADESGEMTAVWFNQPYMAGRLKAGERYRFAGTPAATKFGIRFTNPTVESVDGAARVAERVVPVYPLASGLSQRVMRLAVSRALEDAASELEDFLPAPSREAHKLMELRDALVSAHAPGSMGEAARASRRLAFDELFRIQLAIGRARRLRSGRTASPVPFAKDEVKAFVESLPFTITGDQRQAAWDVIRDMGRETPMHRLLDGDVGSGKTAVAAIAMANCVAVGSQASLMAPTEILARQHYGTLRKMFAKLPVSIALWTGGYRRSSRRGRETVADGKEGQAALRQRVAEGGIGIVVGTHALVEDSLRFSRLALAVVDEQHRFGVGARKALAEKSGIPGVEPHFLSMTATPIPRSLALAMYGDLDVSLLKMKPDGRRPVDTMLVEPRRRARAYALMREEIAAGRQAFVVCPLIDPSDTLGVSSVAEECERLAAVFKDAKIAALHGRMAKDDKESVMADFADGRTDILVSTSVIEVGVDVPNATVMLIEGAERFGMAQLHQFRGRVGRGAHRSYCLLAPSELSSTARERLEAVAATTDGFALAEKDLALRGPGDILGEAQTGYSRLALASLTDLTLVDAAKREAAAVLEDDPDLARHPALARLVRERADEAHLE
jgi:ATP-dependent DNA helicase RecG